MKPTDMPARSSTVHKPRRKPRYAHVEVINDPDGDVAVKINSRRLPAAIHGRVHVETTRQGAVVSLKIYATEATITTIHERKDQ